MANKGFWTGVLVVGGVLAAGMGWGMLGVMSGCQKNGEKSSASQRDETATPRGGHRVSQGGHSHVHGEGGHMAAGREPQAARTAKRPPSIFDNPPPDGTKAYCPVMKKTFFVTKSSPRTRYNGKWVYFCCSSCKGKFEANPKAYLN